jgi:hypothetical protein
MKKETVVYYKYLYSINGFIQEINDFFSKKFYNVD